MHEAEASLHFQGESFGLEWEMLGMVGADRLELPTLSV